MNQDLLFLFLASEGCLDEFVLNIETKTDFYGALGFGKNVIKSAFAWSETIEGHEFWSNINKKWYEFLKKQKQEQESEFELTSNEFVALRVMVIEELGNKLTEQQKESLIDLIRAYINFEILVNDLLELKKDELKKVMGIVNDTRLKKDQEILAKRK